MKRFPIFILVSLFAFACAPPATRLTLPNPGYDVEDNVNRPANPIFVSRPQPYRIKLSANFTVIGNTAQEDLIATLPLPPDTPHQKIIGWDVYPKSYRVVTSRYGYRFLEFNLGKSGSSNITYTAEADLAKIRYDVSRALVGAPADIPEQIRADYTADGPYYNIRSKTVIEALQKAAGDEKDLYLLLHRVWDFTRRSLTYRLDGRKVAADRTLSAGSGSCTEYSFVIIALCRAAGLPARYTSGTFSPPPGKRWGRDRWFHKVAEVYLPKVGWVPIESTRGTRLSEDEQKAKFFVAQDARLFGFIYEPEPGLVRNDPRKNTVSFHSSGPGRMVVRLSVAADWIRESLGPPSAIPQLDIAIDPSF